MILVTGGAGYIGSHTICELQQTQHEVIVLDNFSNSTPVVFDKIKKITGKETHYIQADIRDENALNAIFEKYCIDSVIHFAGLKSVNESMSKPTEYFDVNVSGSIQLLKAMQKANVRKLIFSSSASVYGESDYFELNEDMPLGKPLSHYSLTKIMIEQALEALVESHPELQIGILRYFNPIGAHPSGFIGENPQQIPNNLVPYITQVAVGQLPFLNVYGHDYPTPDGTGIRDYIHVKDLALGHVAALEFLEHHKGKYTWNLGTGKGYSVLDVIHTFQEINQIKLPYQFKPRREGDIIACWANADKAQNELGWKAVFNLADMLKDAWNWQKSNPRGF